MTLLADPSEGRPSLPFFHFIFFAYALVRSRARLASSGPRRRIDEAPSMRRRGSIDASMVARQCVDLFQSKCERSETTRERGCTVTRNLSLFLYRSVIDLLGVQRILLHHGVDVAANCCDVLLVLGVVEHALDEFGNLHHHVFLGTTCGDGGCT